MVAAVALATVVEDYEAAIRDAGFSPGVVMPSMMAALGAAAGESPTLVVKVDARTTSIAILNAQQLQLFRTLENTRGVTITGEQLAEEVYPSVVFFQDTYHLNIEKIFVAGIADIGNAAPALRAQTDAEVQESVDDGVEPLRVTDEQVPGRSEIVNQFAQDAFLGGAIEVNENVAAKDGVDFFRQKIVCIHKVESTKFDEPA